MKYPCKTRTLPKSRFFLTGRLGTIDRTRGRCRGQPQHNDCTKSLSRRSLSRVQSSPGPPYFPGRPSPRNKFRTCWAYQLLPVQHWRKCENYSRGPPTHSAPCSPWLVHSLPSIELWTNIMPCSTSFTKNRRKLHLSFRHPIPIGRSLGGRRNAEPEHNQHDRRQETMDSNIQLWEGYAQLSSLRLEGHGQQCPQRSVRSHATSEGKN